jgi:S1-C subfamily serine protease
MLRAAVIAVVGSLALAGAASSAAGSVPHPDRATVLVEATGCRAVSDVATGWRGPGGLVVTVAHAVRGSAAVTAGGVPARIVALDLRADVAVLAPAAEHHSLALAAAPGATKGGPAWVGHIADGSARSTATTAGRGVVINIDEPADDTTYTRAGLSLTFGAVRGDSGAAVVDRAGAVIGMVFATARADTHLSYAVSAAEIAAVLSGLTPQSPTVPTGRCG